MTDGITWDHQRRVGPVWLGMGETALKSVLPGRTLDATEDPGSTVLEGDGYIWESGEFGLSVLVVDGIVVSISAVLEFLVDGDNIIGMPEAEALWRLGGEVAREPGAVEIVQTAAGIDIHCVDGDVMLASLDDFSLIKD